MYLSLSNNSLLPNSFIICWLNRGIIIPTVFWGVELSSSSNYSSKIEVKTFIKLSLMFIWGGDLRCLKALVFNGVLYRKSDYLASLSSIKVILEYYFGVTKLISCIVFLSNSYDYSQLKVLAIIPIFNFLLIVEFQWFLMQLSVLPGKNLEMMAHLFPWILWAAIRIVSSFKLHLAFFIWGFKWLCHLSLHCLPTRLTKCFAILDQFFGPWISTKSNRAWSSSLDQLPFKRFLFSILLDFIITGYLKILSEQGWLCWLGLSKSLTEWRGYLEFALKADFIVYLRGFSRMLNFWWRFLSTFSLECILNKN